MAAVISGARTVILFLFLIYINFIYDLFQSYHKKQCDQCGKVPKDPAVCLMCGTMVCMRETCCRKQIVVNQGNKEGEYIRLEMIIILNYHGVPQ